MYYVYILANKPNGLIYVGSTGNLAHRISQHKLGNGSRYTQKYNIKTLVYFTDFYSIDSARQFETKLKKWKRDWKVKLIEEANPNWLDLSNYLNG